MNAGILIHPASSQIIYARQDVSGLVRWDNAKKSWLQITDWMPASWWNAKGCAGFAVDASAGTDVKRQNTIYAAFGGWQNPTQMSPDGNGVFRSFDGGKIWSKVWDGNPVTIGKFKVYSFAANTNARTAGKNLAVDPFNPDVLWVGTNNDGLWQSIDARSEKPTFSKVESAPKGFWNHPYEANGIRSILIDPRGGFVGEGGQKRAKILFLGAPKPPANRVKTIPEGTQTGVFRSLDGGVTWEVLEGPNAPTSVWRLALGEKVGQIIVSVRGTSDNKGLRMFDGTNWKIAPETENATFGGVVSAPSGLIVAGGATDATWVSSDWGQT